MEVLSKWEMQLPEAREAVQKFKEQREIQRKTHDDPYSQKIYIISGSYLGFQTLEVQKK